MIDSTMNPRGKQWKDKELGYALGLGTF